MSTPTLNQAQTTSQTNHDSITSAIDANFIAATDQQIQDAMSKGLFFISCTAEDGVDSQQIFNHYAGLGYQVTFPDFPQNQAQVTNPSNLFGEFWIAFWNGVKFFDPNRKPVRFLISWNP